MNRNIGLLLVMIAIGCVVVGFGSVALIRSYEAYELFLIARAGFCLAMSGLVVLVGALGYGIFRYFTNRKRMEVRHHDL